MATTNSERHIQAHQSLRAFRPTLQDNAPAVSWRGIITGLWLTSTTVILLALVPGIALSLGNLPGDIGAGSNADSVRLPIATITLLVVTLTGICYRISSFLSRL